MSAGAKRVEASLVDHEREPIFAERPHPFPSPISERGAKRCQNESILKKRFSLVRFSS